MRSGVVTGSDGSCGRPASLPRLPSGWGGAPACGPPPASVRSAGLLRVIVLLARIIRSPSSKRSPSSRKCRTLWPAAPPVSSPAAGPPARRAGRRRDPADRGGDRPVHRALRDRRRDASPARTLPRPVFPIACGSRRAPPRAGAAWRPAHGRQRRLRFDHRQALLQGEPQCRAGFFSVAVDDGQLLRQRLGAAQQRLEARIRQQPPTLRRLAEFDRAGQFIEGGGEPRALRLHRPQVELALRDRRNGAGMHSGRQALRRLRGGGAGDRQEEGGCEEGGLQAIALQQSACRRPPAALGDAVGGKCRHRPRIFEGAAAWPAEIHASPARSSRWMKPYFSSL